MTTSVDVLNEAIAAEHEAVFAYPVIAAQISSLSKLALTELKIHRVRRDYLISLVEKQNRPVALPEAAYAVGELNSRSSGEELARKIEENCQARYAQLILGNEATEKAIDWLIASAVTLMKFGDEPQAFPGVTFENS